MNGGHEILSYSLYDLMGRKMSYTKMDRPTRSTQVNCSSLPNGTYVIRAQTTYGTQIQKIEKLN